MKKLALFLFVASTILFTSCSGDDDGGAPPFIADESLIPGDWNLQEVRSENGTFTTTFQGLPVSGTYIVSGKDYAATISFTKSATAGEPNTTSGSGSFTLVASFNIPTQQPIVVEEPVPDLIGTGEWTLNGNTLTTTAQGESIAYEIIALTAQSMTLKFVINEQRTVDSALGPVTLNITGDQFVVLNK